MKGFRQIRTGNLDLMQVQDNVRDALNEVAVFLQGELPSLFSNYGLVKTALASGVNTSFGNLDLPRGVYKIRSGCLCEVIMTSGVPTTVEGTCRIFNLNDLIVLENTSGTSGVGLGAGLPLADALTYRAWVIVQGNLDWPGGKIDARARIATAGGTVSSRNVRDGFIEATRVKQ